MPTCNTVVLDQGIRGVHPVTRSHLPSCLHEQRRPSSSLGLPTPHSLAYYDVFVVEVLPNTTAKLEDNHELICPIVIGYTRPALIRWKSKIDFVKKTSYSLRLKTTIKRFFRLSRNMIIFEVDTDVSSAYQGRIHKVLIGDANLDLIRKHDGLPLDQTTSPLPPQSPLPTILHWGLHVTWQIIKGHHPETRVKDPIVATSDGDEGRGG